MSVLLVVLVFIQTLVSVGCSAVDTTTQPLQPVNPPPSQPSAECGPPVTPTFTAQYLYGADIAESNNLWVYKIDPATGALTEMPWSPLKTLNNPHTGTGDPTGQYVYIGEDNPFNSTIDRLMEAYRLPPDDGPPQKVGHIGTGYPGQIAFDPYGKYLYLSDPVGTVDASGVTGTIEPYRILPGGMPERAPGPYGVMTPRYANGMTFKASGNLVITPRTSTKPESEGSIYVWRQNCADGGLTKLSEYADKKAVRFVAAPATGRTIASWDCAANNPVIPGLPTNGLQLLSVDSQSGALAPVLNGFYPGLCWPVFDPSGKFMAAAVLDDPENAISAKDTLAIFRFDEAQQTLTETDRVKFPRMPISNATRDLTMVAFDLTENYVYGAIGGSQVVGFRLDRTTGKLTSVPGSPYSSPVYFMPFFVVGRK